MLGNEIRDSNSIQNRSLCILVSDTAKHIQRKLTHTHTHTHTHADSIMVMLRSGVVEVVSVCM